MLIHGWDINKANLFEACKRSHVLEPDLVNQLKPELSEIVPLPAVVNQDFIAANQADRMDNLFKGTNVECIAKIRKDIQNMKEKVDKVVVLWTANTEMMMYPELKEIGDVQQMIERNGNMPSSVLFCVAAIEEQVLYLNGSP